MTTRRGNLGKARDESNSEQDVRHRLATIDDLQQQIAQRLIDARRVLVQEIVAIFGVKKRVSGDWEIAGLVLPSPDLFRSKSVPRFGADDSTSSFEHQCSYLPCDTSPIIDHEISLH